MFGSLKVNGVKVDKVVTVKDAQPGFLMIESPQYDTNSKGDLIYKFPDGRVVNLTKPHAWHCGEIVKPENAKTTVCYVDVELNFKKVENGHV